MMLLFVNALMPFDSFILWLCEKKKEKKRKKTKGWQMKADTSGNKGKFNLKRGSAFGQR